MQKHLHLIGAGGIGMSGLAQLFVKLGYRVTGSDRDYQKPENRRILDKLELQGITIYPQDGSYRDAGTPDFLVYSTAIEEDNPDFLRGEGIPRLHRSEALALALEEGGYENSIAITGSCGKSTVTAYLAEALVNLNADPDCLNGGLVNRFRYGRFAGNYRAGDGKYFIFEADESDRSLVRYAPDYAVILNIGTDHYSKEELAEVFGTFLRRVKRGAVMARSVFDALGDLVPENLPVKIFEDAIGATSDLAVRTIRKIRQTDAIYIGGASAAIDPQTGNSALDERDGANNLLRIYGAAPEDFRLMRDTYRAEMPDGTTWQMPRPGEHNALNALAVMGVLEFLGFSRQQAAESLEIFGGVWRRFDDHGTAPSGARVFDDYAHNPEKILSALQTAFLSGDGNVYAVFQPHGYRPLEFMQHELYEMLQRTLRCGDTFIMMEPFYAGGTTSFKPSAEEVIAEYRLRSGKDRRYLTFPDRDHLSDYLLLKSRPGDVILILGARDNSLSDYAASLGSPEK